MNEVQQLGSELRRLIGQSRDVTDQTSFNQVFIIAENIIGTLAYLISPITLMEQKYRLKVLQEIDTGSSTAKAEARAKASEEYVEWKKFQMLYDLGHEQVKLLKKFKDRLENDYHSQ